MIKCILGKKKMAVGSLRKAKDEWDIMIRTATGPIYFVKTDKKGYQMFDHSEHRKRLELCHCHKGADSIQG